MNYDYTRCDSEDLSFPYESGKLGSTTYTRCDSEDLYIADHLCRIDIEFADRPELRNDSYWRIASVLNIRVGPEKPLTLGQWAELNEFIDRFRNSPHGAAAIAEVKAANALGYRSEDVRYE